MSSKKGVSAPKHPGETKDVFILRKHDEAGAGPIFGSLRREECTEKTGGKEWLVNWRNTHERKEIDRAELPACSTQPEVPREGIARRDRELFESVS